MEVKRVVIVGGGFGGIQTALELAKKGIPGLKITLISDKPHFEYHATLYRILSGRSPMQVCIPITDIIDLKKVEFIKDRISEVDLQNKVVKSSEFDYKYDYLVLALGGQNNFYNIDGLGNLAFTSSTMEGILKLKNHMHSQFATFESMSQDERVPNLHFVIVGGGVSGVEVAGELATYLRKLAIQHKADPSYITIDLIHAQPRLVPMFPEDVSENVLHRLHSLGVNVYLNRSVLKEDFDNIYMKDMQLKTKTLIWTAGVKINEMYNKITGLEFDKRGRVIVDEHLHIKGNENVFVIGDGAATEFTGMAQTALYDGEFAARTIESQVLQRELHPYVAKKPFFAIPVGDKWAAGKIGNFTMYGIWGWLLRKWADWTVFRIFLPFGKAVTAFRSDKYLWESCPVCKEYIAKYEQS
jgi:NADH:ubiquinone reductase (H+-translocating)